MSSAGFLWQQQECHGDSPCLASPNSTLSNQLKSSMTRFEGNPVRLVAVSLGAEGWTQGPRAQGKSSSKNSCGIELDFTIIRDISMFLQIMRFTCPSVTPGMQRAPRTKSHRLQT